MGAKKKSKLIGNAVDHPSHYTSHPSGIEAIELCGRMGFCIGNAFKYLYRLDKKWDSLEDIKKARWYIDRELFQRGAKMPIRSFDIDSFRAAWKEEFEDFNRAKLSVPDYQQVDFILKIVGKTPTDIEKALFYLWQANRLPGWRFFLYRARSYVNAEIRRRQRQHRKGNAK